MSFKFQKGVIGLFFQKTKVLIYILFYLCSLTSYAQYFLKSTEWKKYIKEFYCGVGSSNFLGDLGGLDRIGKDFSPVDLEWTLNSFSAGVGYKYKVFKWLNLSIGTNFLKVKGDDKLTKDPYRNNRNLNFKSNIFELMGRV